VIAPAALELSGPEAASLESASRNRADVLLIAIAPFTSGA
jgi:hypothetical protein